jgi:N-acyl-D-aspartate/D-glutamate deacylase
MAYELVVRGGLVVDGTGAAPREADAAAVLIEVGAPVMKSGPWPGRLLRRSDG